MYINTWFFDFFFVWPIWLSFWGRFDLWQIWPGLIWLGTIWPGADVTGNLKIQLCLLSTKWTLSSHRKVIFSSHDIDGIKFIWCWTTHPFTNVFENIQQINRKKERGHSILVLKKHFSLVVHGNELLYISSANGISIRILSMEINYLTSLHCTIYV